MQTVTLTSWQTVAGYEVEWACDYYYEDNVCVGHSTCYYTGKYRPKR